VSGKYFYDPEGLTTEPLFSAMMKEVLELSPQTKHEGLSEFAARDYPLLDATYTPVNIPGQQKRAEEGGGRADHQGLRAARRGTAQAPAEGRGLHRPE
jgi:hypothetical protein